MIPHHQVAIDMSRLLIPKSKNPIIQHLCRDIIRKQSYEIWEMEHMKKYQDNIFRDTHINNETIVTKLELHNPVLSKSKDVLLVPCFE